METILVTGGAGYVGAVLVPKLLKAGHRVRVLDLFLYADTNLFAKHPNLELIKGDLRNTTTIDKSLKDSTCIIHLAGVSNDPCTDLDPELTREINIRGTQRLIDKARDLGVARFINASSSSVYGIKDEPNVTEDLALEPLTVYSESKAVIEDYLERHRGRMAAISIRSATVCGYSPRMRLDLTVNILTHHALKKGKITVFGGSQKRPNIHIEDITDLYTRLVEMPREKIDGKVYNACGANHTVMDIAELVQKTVAPGIPIDVAPTNDLRSYHINADKIARELDFVPRRTIQDAIADVASAIRSEKLTDLENDQYYNVRVMKKYLKGNA